MSQFAEVSLPCRAGGFSTISLNMAVIRTGGDNDRYGIRMKRIGPGGAEVILPGTPEFVMLGVENTVNWTWIDMSIPADGTYVYRLQVRRIDGGGIFREMNLIGQHHKV